MIPISIKVPVAAEVVFPRGAMFMGVEAATDFDLRGKSADDQARDKDTGERIWHVTVIDLEEPDEGQKFRRAVELRVRVIAPYRPVPPPARVEGYPPIVTFEGLTLTPWLDDAKCKPPRAGESHRCRARLSFSLKASAMVEFTAALA